MLISLSNSVFFLLLISFFLDRHRFQLVFLGFLEILAQFFWVSPNPPGFYWVLPSFTGFSWRDQPSNTAITQFFCRFDGVVLEF